MDIKQQDAENKALLAEARARASGAGAEAAASKAETAARGLDIKTQGAQLRAAQDLRKGYETYRNNVEKTNEAINTRRFLDPSIPAPTPPLSQEEWIRATPSAKAAAEASGLYGTTGVTQPGTYSTPSRTPAEALGASGGGGIVDIQTPEEALKLRPGTRYRNPAGEVYTR
jgi:hypothetical protein